MIIKEFEPSFALKPYIKSFILIEDTNGHIGNKWMSIYPSGHLEMIFSYGDQTVFSKDGFVLNGTSGYLGGQSLEPYQYKCLGKLKIVSTILKPWGMYKILNTPQEEYTDYLVDLKPIFGKKSDLIAEQLCVESDHKRKIELVEKFLIGLLNWKPADRLPVVFAADMIEKTSGAVSVTEICKTLNLSIKTLERNFKKMIGLTPKAFSRIIRFNSTLNELNENKKASIQDLVYKYGYYDQSHLINDFKQFTAHTPSDHINKESNVTFSFREIIQI